MPFDPLSLGYAPGRTPRESLRFIATMVREAAQIAQKLERHLPADFPIGQHAETIAMLEADVVALLPGTDPHH
jgi:hypothetical protein